MYLNKWDESVHNMPDQQKRRESAKSQDMQILSLNVKAKSGNIKSRSGSVYQVTTEDCTCTDFKMRKLPCKHMYMLDLALEKELLKALDQKQTTVAKAKGKGKNKILEFYLALLFGWTGAHRFYTGKIVSGIIWLLTGGLFLIGWIVDMLVILIRLLMEMSSKKTIDSAMPVEPEVKPEVEPEIVQPLSENTDNKRESYCEEFDSLMKNIPSVDIALRDEKVLRKTEETSPFARTSSITSKTNTKKISSFIVIDVETTGLKAEKDDIIEISAIKFNEFKPEAVFSTLLKPRKPIPADATAVNNITNAMVANSPTFSQIKSSIEDFIGDLPIVAHNAGFDIGFLHASGLDFSSKVKFFDTLSLSRKHITDQDGNKLGSYKLIDVCAECDIYFDGAHRSTADALATGLLFIEIIKRVFETNSVSDIQPR